MTKSSLILLLILYQAGLGLLTFNPLVRLLPLYDLAVNTFILWGMFFLFYWIGKRDRLEGR